MSLWKGRGAVKKASSEKVSLLKKQLLWKVGAPKNSSSEKATLLKNYFFWRSTFVEKVAALKKFDDVKKYLLPKSSSSVNVFIMYKLVLQRNNSSKKVALLKNYLLSRSSWSVEVLLLKSSFSEKITAEKK